MIVFDEGARLFERAKKEATTSSLSRSSSLNQLHSNGVGKDGGDRDRSRYPTTTITASSSSSSLARDGRDARDYKSSRHSRSRSRDRYRDRYGSRYDGSGSRRRRSRSRSRSRSKSKSRSRSRSGSRSRSRSRDRGYTRDSRGSTYKRSDYRERDTYEPGRRTSGVGSYRPDGDYDSRDKVDRYKDGRDSRDGRDRGRDRIREDERDRYAPTRPIIAGEAPPSQLPVSRFNWPVPPTSAPRPNGISSSTAPIAPYQTRPYPTTAAPSYPPPPSSSSIISPTSRTPYDHPDYRRQFPLSSAPSAPSQPPHPSAPISSAVSAATPAKPIAAPAPPPFVLDEAAEQDIRTRAKRTLLTELTTAFMRDVRSKIVVPLLVNVLPTIPVIEPPKPKAPPVSIERKAPVQPIVKPVYEEPVRQRISKSRDVEDGSDSDDLSDEEDEEVSKSMQTLAKMIDVSPMKSLPTFKKRRKPEDELKSKRRDGEDEEGSDAERRQSKDVGDDGKEDRRKRRKIVFSDDSDEESDEEDNGKRSRRHRRSSSSSSAASSSSSSSWSIPDRDTSDKKAKVEVEEEDTEVVKNENGVADMEVDGVEEKQPIEEEVPGKKKGKGGRKKKAAIAKEDDDMAMQVDESVVDQLAEDDAAAAAIVGAKKKRKTKEKDSGAKGGKGKKKKDKQQQDEGTIGAQVDANGFVGEDDSASTLQQSQSKLLGDDEELAELERFLSKRPESLSKDVLVDIENESGFAGHDDGGGEMSDEFLDSVDVEDISNDVDDQRYLKIVVEEEKRKRGRRHKKDTATSIAEKKKKKEKEGRSRTFKLMVFPTVSCTNIDSSASSTEPAPHKSGSARTEGYYAIPEEAKRAYLTSHDYWNNPSELTAANGSSSSNLSSMAKSSSRANRINHRQLALGLEQQKRAISLSFGGGAVDSDLLKFNQLKARKKKLKFAKSAIHDWGLFAMEPVDANDMVIEYIGTIIRQKVADHREKEYEKMGIGSSYLFRVDDDTIIDATKLGNLARFINHCCDVSLIFFISFGLFLNAEQLLPNIYF